MRCFHLPCKAKSTAQALALANFAEVTSEKNGQIANQATWRRCLCQECVSDVQSVVYSTTVFVPASLLKFSCKIVSLTSFLEVEAPQTTSHIAQLRSAPASGGLFFFSGAEFIINYKFPTTNLFFVCGLHTVRLLKRACVCSCFRRPRKDSVVLVGQVVSIGLHSPSCQLTVSISLPQLRSDESSWNISKHALAAHYKHASKVLTYFWLRRSVN